eukprot:Colp12_sorted_trinity150504_noHs@14901
MLLGKPRLMANSAPCQQWPHNGAVRFVVISDTHSMHNELQVPDGDVLLHCGDFSKKGGKDEATAFNEWLGKIQGSFSHKILVVGNHDVGPFTEFQPAAAAELLTNCICLDNSSITISGINIYGSGWNRKANRKIPNCDILMTHDPPKGICDDGKWGCEYLLKDVNKIRPKYHCFGHVHEAFGQVTVGETTYINAALAANGMRPTHLAHEAIVFDLFPPK